MRDWSARVEWPVQGELTGDQVTDLDERLAPHSGRCGQEAHGSASAQLTVQARTLRQATDAAVRAIEAACKDAGLRCAVEAVDVCTWEEFERRQAEPIVPPLAGVREISEILGVSRQRAGEVIQRNPGAFPEVARLASGPVYLEASARRFEATWERKRTGRPRKNAS